MQTFPANLQPSLGSLLRYWRQERGRSQLDLSTETGISQRHLSFVETGRSIPSRGMLSTVADALNIPLRERNRLLLSAGYAPAYQEPQFQDAPMDLVTRAIDRMLEQHELHPALVLDRRWNVVRTNSAAPRFFASFLDLEAWPKPRNLIELIFDPAGLRPFVENWNEVAAGLLQRVRREAVGGVLDEKLTALVTRMKGLSGISGTQVQGLQQSPVLPITFRRGEERFPYFSLVTTVGTPQCITAQELRIECMFPVSANRS